MKRILLLLLVLSSILFATVGDDGDGVLDDVDNCPYIYNPGQENHDNDVSGDACDVDDDNDGLHDVDDNCPLYPNPAQSDSDGDDVGNECDNCPGYNPGQEDNDGDDTGDVCDSDDDNDGVLDNSDDDQFNPDVCEDADGDACDDCVIGTDDFGPLADNTPNNDGTDTDSDGICDIGDIDPFNPDICGDLDGDGRDDCTPIDFCPAIIQYILD